MQKLSYYNIEKMIKSKVTSKEFDFIIYISQMNNEFGVAQGVYYNEVCKRINICNQTFYDILESLQEKGIITVIKNNPIDYDVTLLDNDFPTPDSFKKGYIATNLSFFNTKKFKKLKVGSKLLFLEMYKISSSKHAVTEKSRSVCMDLVTFYEKYKDLFEVTKRVIASYLNGLKDFFSIGIKDRKYYITPLTETTRYKTEKEADPENKDSVKVLCRREKVKILNDKDLTDAGNILLGRSRALKELYGLEYKDKLLEVLKSAVIDSLAVINKHTPNQRKWERVLKPSLVHKIMKEYLEELFKGSLVHNN